MVNSSGAGPKVSVVIATLGAEYLQKTIDSLLRGSLGPAEILICTPEEFTANVNHLASESVRIIPTVVKGQVKQRAVGLTMTNSELVMQLDDDILVEQHFLNDLVTCLTKLGKGNTVGPVYYTTGNPRRIHMLQNGLIKNIFDCVVCAAPWGKKKMGIVTSIGLNYGVDDSYVETELFATDWLPGACSLSFRDDLVTEDYFPFAGKAYCEDIYQSYYRRQKGVKHWVATRLRVYTDEPVSRLDKATTEKEITIRRYYVKLSNGPLWRLSIYESFCRVRSFLYPFVKKN